MPAVRLPVFTLPEEQFMRSRFFVPFALCSLAFAVSAQVPKLPVPATPKPVDPKAVAARTEKQMLLADQILTDTDGLRLGENRAFVLAKVGTLVWKTDKKAAQALFQRAVNDLLNAQMQAETEEKGSRSTQLETWIGQQIRPAILTMIGALDAEFALDSLYRTRTAAIQRALAASGDLAAAAANKVTESNGSASYIAMNEFNTEQRLIRLAAEQNPEKAAKLLQESIKKGLSNETLSMLKKLFEKDPELANSLAAETLDRIMSTSFTTNASESSAVALAISILNDAIRDKKPGAKELKFDEMTVRSLANKTITFYLGQDARYSGGRIPMLIKIAEKLSPGMVAALKKLEKSSLPPGASNMIPNSDTRKLMESNASAAQLLAEAKKLTPDTRGPAYQAAASRMAQTGDIGGAMELVNANFSGRALENAIAAINYTYANTLISQGKWSEAERVIDEFPEPSMRRTYLITLATRAYAKDPVENKSLAITVLQKVRSTLPDRPSDQGELTNFMQLAMAFSGIEVEQAFMTFEPIVPQLNELADASAVVQGFQSVSNVRSGEFIIANGGMFGFQLDQNLIRTFAKADFERTLKLIDTFTRREMRIGVRLQLAENGLN